MIRPPNPRCGFWPGCDSTVSVHVLTILTGVPSCGLSLSRKGHVLSRRRKDGVFHSHACNAAVLESVTTKTSKKLTRPIVLRFVFMLLVCGFPACPLGTAARSRAIEPSRLAAPAVAATGNRRAVRFPL